MGGCGVRGHLQGRCMCGDAAESPGVRPHAAGHWATHPALLCLPHARPRSTRRCCSWPPASSSAPPSCCWTRWPPLRGVKGCEGVGRVQRTGRGREECEGHVGGRGGRTPMQAVRVFEAARGQAAERGPQQGLGQAGASPERRRPRMTRPPAACPIACCSFRLQRRGDAVRAVHFLRGAAGGGGPGPPHAQGPGG